MRSQRRRRELPGEVWIRAEEPQSARASIVRPALFKVVGLATGKDVGW